MFVGWDIRCIPKRNTSSHDELVTVPEGGDHGNLREPQVLPALLELLHPLLELGEQGPLRLTPLLLLQLLLLLNLSTYRQSPSKFLEVCLNSEYMR